MNTSSGNFPTELNHVTGLPSWWGLSKLINTGDMESSLKKFQAIKTDMNRLFHMNRLFQEASSAQAQSLKAVNERSIGYFQELFDARQPSELMKAQSNIITAFIEGLSDQTRTWLELTQKMQDRGSAMVREKAAETAVEAEAAVEVEEAVEAEAEDYPGHAVFLDEEPEANEPVDKQTVRSLLKADTGKRPASKSRSVSRAGKR